MNKYSHFYRIISWISVCGISFIVIRSKKKKLKNVVVEHMRKKWYWSIHGYAYTYNIYAAQHDDEKLYNAFTRHYNNLLYYRH